MPGRIVSVGAAEGAAVTKGQKLVVVEAMKMELALSAPFDGVVEALKVKLGDQVAEGALLVQVGTDKRD
jgi:3-methylcrotonyl-CoA carboxylase alpha subunit